MYCDRCGTQLPDSAVFCSTCGKTTGAAPPSRVAAHLRALGILWLAISVYRLIPGVLLFAIFRPMAWSMEPGLPFFVPALIRAIGGLLLAGAVLGIVTGWGLLERQPWARALAILLAVFSLLEVPFGTALAIYTFWVLLPAGSEEEYRRMAEAGRHA